MKSFWSYISNGEYSVGCTGQTVYIYNNCNEEIAKLKDLKYAYTSAISPDGKTLVIKSTEGSLAIYSLNEKSLIKKFRFSKINCGQDAGFCFSDDGKYFLDIEHIQDGCNSLLSIYSTSNFDVIERILPEGNASFTAIERGDINGIYYLLGFERDTENVASKFFVCQMSDNKVKMKRYITAKEHDYYYWYIGLKCRGFTKKSYEWSRLAKDFSLKELKDSDHRLKDLFECYHK